MSRRAFPADDPFKSTLISPAQLHEALQKQSKGSAGADARIVCLSSAFFLPNDPEGRTAHSSFKKHRIPNSQLFDLDVVCDKKSSWPHMLPSAASFAEKMSLLGVRRSDSVVCFDTPELGLFSAPRAAWTLTHFGHPRVHVLDNFKLWVQMGLPVESGDDVPADIEDYRLSSDEVRHLDVAMADVQQAISANLAGAGETAIIVDARPHARWAGTAPEPRQGIPSGHMPTSVSVPFTDVLDPANKTMLSPEDLRKLFHERLDYKKGQAIISTCGTGVTAAVIDLALEHAGISGMEAQHRKIYDGSWTEWGSRLQGDERWITQK